MPLIFFDSGNTLLNAVAICAGNARGKQQKEKVKEREKRKRGGKKKGKNGVAQK